MMLRADALHKTRMVLCHPRSAYGSTAQFGKKTAEARRHNCAVLPYISCLPSNARERVTSSAYSSWLPTGTP